MSTWANWCGQMDGSHHDWFEGRRGWAVLMVMIDDATGIVTARFYENESWASSSDLFQRYALRHGVPRGLYVDQHSIYRPDSEPTGAELLDNCPPETQFGRAMRQAGRGADFGSESASQGACRAHRTGRFKIGWSRRCGVRRSPAWKRRTNSWTTHFWRNSTLASRWQQLGAEDWHRPLSAATDLARIVSIQESRVVGKDWTLRWRNRILQLPREAAEFICSGQRVTVCEPLDGVLRVFASEREVSWSPILAPPPPKRAKRTGPTGSSQGQKPAANHPWRRRRAPAARPEPSVPLPPPAKKWRAPLRLAALASRSPPF